MWVTAWVILLRDSRGFFRKGCKPSLLFVKVCGDFCRGKGCFPRNVGLVTRLSEDLILLTKPCLVPWTSMLISSFQIIYP